MTARFSGRPDVLGYWTTTDGRWKAKPHPTGEITLADTTRRARFETTGASYTRLPDWATVRRVVETFEEQR